MDSKLKLEKSDERVIRLYMEDGEYVAYGYSAIRLKNRYPSVQLVRHQGRRGKKHYLTASFPRHGALAGRIPELNDDAPLYFLELPSDGLEDWQKDSGHIVPDLVLYPEQENRPRIPTALATLLQKMVRFGILGHWKEMCFSSR